MKKHIQRRLPKKIKHQKKKLYKKTFAIIIMLSIIILLGLAVSSFYGTQIDQVTKDIKAIATIDIDHLTKEEKNTKSITFEEKTRALEIGYIDNTNNNLYLEKTKKINDKKKTFHFEEPNLEEIDKKEENKIEEPIFTYPQIIDKIKPKEIIEETIKVIKPVSNKPKLAIIIDDVTTKRQIESISNIGYTVNMAFLPPTSGHKNSAKITNNLDLYMIHLPLQASSSQYEEENTLYINHSIERIDERIKNLKLLYPKAVFLNNHTGSKFTSNQVAMDKLFQVLKKYDYTFIDSRTTAKSVALKSSKKYGVKMFSRNIFLDNKKDKNYIQKQLKKAIKSAKKNGMAIAIGHPYGITFKTLKESKHLLKDLELVYVHQL